MVRVGDVVSWVCLVVFIGCVGVPVFGIALAVKGERAATGEKRTEGKRSA